RALARVRRVGADVRVPEAGALRVFGAAALADRADVVRTGQRLVVVEERRAVGVDVTLGEVEGRRAGAGDRREGAADGDPGQQLREGNRHGRKAPAFTD